MATSGLELSGLSGQKLTVGKSAAPIVPFRPKRAHKLAARRCSVSTRAAAGGSKNVLMLGGTRFIGVYLARQLIEEGHQVTLLTRGKKPVTFKIPDDTDSSFANYEKAVQHIAADRSDPDGLKQAISGKGFDVVYDMNGREATDAAPVVEALPDIEQYIFCSSAGVYLKSDQMPHREEDAVDPKSRHKGKLDTESLLQEKGVNWTSVRPVYIYGPLNYNPVEEWFFQRIAAKRPIPVPGTGMQVTQLGHVKDLADAFQLCLGNSKAYQQVFNISGERFVTFDGIAKACAEAAGASAPELVHFNPKTVEIPKGTKAFPMRDQHFFASIDKAESVLGWKPKFSLVEGLRDSYEKDFGRGTMRKEPNFAADDAVLAAVKK